MSARLRSVLDEQRRPLVEEDYELVVEDRVIERQLIALARRVADIRERRKAISLELLDLDGRWREGESMRQRMRSA